jgi:hypothetical protein
MDNLCERPVRKHRHETFLMEHLLLRGKYMNYRHIKYFERTAHAGLDSAPVIFDLVTMDWTHGKTLRTIRRSTCSASVSNYLTKDTLDQHLCFRPFYSSFSKFLTIARSHPGLRFRFLCRSQRRVFKAPKSLQLFRYRRF